MDEPIRVEMFSQLFESYQKQISTDMVAQGFWDYLDPSSVEVKLAKVALLMTELAELVEGIRNNIEKSDHIPDFSSEEEELADLLIRAMDYAGFYHLDLVGAFLRKIKYNQTREFRHGKTA